MFVNFKSFFIAADLVMLVTLEKVVYIHQIHASCMFICIKLVETSEVEDFLQLSHWEDALFFH